MLGRLVWAVLLIVGLPVLSFAAHVHWMGDYSAARQKAQSTHKPLMVLLIKAGQKYSRDIVQQQFMDQPYIDSINKHFIPVMIGDGVKMSYPIEMYYTTVFPTLFFVDSSRELFLTKPLYGKEIKAERLAKIMQDLGILPKK